MRDIAMATTWRLIAFTTTMLVVAFLTWNANGTADWTAAGLTGAIAGSIKMILYVIHNRAYRRWWDANETETVNPVRSLKALCSMGLLASVVRDANDPLNDEFYVLVD